MNAGGDAAEQVVRLSLEGAEVAAKITGNGAKNIALLLYAALKEEKKTKGKTRLTNMLKSGKELKVYTITQKDLAKFAEEAKRYGVLYCVLKDRNNKDQNAAVDIIARAEDASKIQRITERFRLTTVSRADVSLDVKRDKDKMFPKEKPVKEEPEINPSLAKTDRGRPSAPSSTQANLSNGFHGKTDRPSVREKLEGYKTEIARGKTERVKELAGKAISKGIEAASRAVKSAEEPGRDR